MAVAVVVDISGVVRQDVHEVLVWVRAVPSRRVITAFTRQYKLRIIPLSVNAINSTVSSALVRCRYRSVLVVAESHIVNGNTPASISIEPVGSA